MERLPQSISKEDFDGLDEPAQKGYAPDKENPDTYRLSLVPELADRPIDELHYGRLRQRIAQTYSERVIKTKVEQLGGMEHCAAVLQRSRVHCLPDGSFDVDVTTEDGSMRQFLPDGRAAKIEHLLDELKGKTVNFDVPRPLQQKRVSAIGLTSDSIIEEKIVDGVRCRIMVGGDAWLGGLRLSEIGSRSERVAWARKLGLQRPSIPAPAAPLPMTPEEKERLSHLDPVSRMAAVRERQG